MSVAPACIALGHRWKSVHRHAAERWHAACACAIPSDRLKAPSMAENRTFAAAANPGIVESLVAAARDARGLIADHLELAALEAQRAAGGFVRMLIAAIVATILLVGAWVTGVVAIASWATRAGISLSATLLAAAAVNVVIAAILFVWLRRQLPELLFASTLRQLRRTVADVDEGEAGR
jgi:uncharacterized membrane protein YqjE